MLTALLLAAVLDEPTQPPPPPASERQATPPEFFDHALTWDSSANVALKGRQKTVLTRAQFFAEVGRLDLVDRSEALRTRRIALFSSAGIVAAAGVIGGVVLLAGSPDMNSSTCVANISNFQRCHDDNRVHQTGGIGLLAGSVAAAMLLATLAWWTNPEVVDTDEAIHLASQYNAGLLRKLRAQAVVTPDGAAVALAGKF